MTCGDGKTEEVWKGNAGETSERESSNHCSFGKAVSRVGSSSTLGTDPVGWGKNSCEDHIAFHPGPDCFV